MRRTLSLLLVAGMAVLPRAVCAQVDLLGLREQLEIARDDTRESVSAWVRAAGEQTFRDGKAGEAFGAYLSTALRVLQAKTEYPEVHAAFSRFDGTFDVEDEEQRGVLGVFLGDYMIVRYGDDLTRELRTLVGMKTFSNVYESNSENAEFRRAFDFLTGLAERLGLSVQNHGYETLEITLEPRGAAARAAPLAMFSHVEVLKPVEYKWDDDKRPYKMTMADGRWVGLGVHTGKGTMLVNLFAMRTLRDAGVRLSRPVVLLVGSETSTADASVQTSLEKMSVQPSVVLAADGTFPYSRGQMGNLIARVASTRGMKSIEGIQPEEFYIYRMSCFWSLNAVPAETRVWVMYEEPLNSLNPSLDIVTKWREITEGYQATVPVTRYGTYVQEDTLHFFSYTLPSHVESPEGRNAIMDMAGCLVKAPMHPNSALDVIRFIEYGFQHDPTGKAAGLYVEHPEMGSSRVNPVQFDRIGDEVAVLVDVRWPVGRDRAWIKKRMQEVVERFNTEHDAQMTLDWESEGREPILHDIDPAVGDLLVEAYEVATGDYGAEPAAVSRSSGTLVPYAIPFGPERSNVAKRGLTRHESITERETGDLAVAYASALAWFGARAALP
jgi:acetylornithine deacetylase/succinyl-diaminopimelate desuccinylase-like protein